MKLILNDSFKHRLVGVIVIVSLALIFVPALVKKSNYRFDEKVSIAVRLPEKPTLPMVIKPQEKEMFESVKVAHVKLPVISKEPQLLEMAKAERISQLPTLNKETALVKAELVAKPAVKYVAAAQKTLTTIAAKKRAPTPAITKRTNKEAYAVQLASFSQQANAQTLVKKLRNQGYKANYMKFSNKQGDFYKVLVGQLEQKQEAQNLQKKLAESVRLNGFVVKTGVS